MAFYTGATRPAAGTSAITAAQKAAAEAKRIADAQAAADRVNTGGIFGIKPPTPAGGGYIAPISAAVTAAGIATGTAAANGRSAANQVTENTVGTGSVPDPMNFNNYLDQATQNFGMNEATARYNAANGIVPDEVVQTLDGEKLLASSNSPQGNQGSIADTTVADGMAAANARNASVAGSSLTTPDPLATDPNRNIFSSNKPLGDAYNQTLLDSVTGKIYDPFAAGQKEATARAEADARASTAGQIAKAGFSGTGIGTGIAGATDNQLLRNRFDTNIGIEKARNETRQAALGEARAYGSDEEQFAVNKNKVALENAIQFGSDADVAAAYKASTGKDLDPLAITQYRDYERKRIEQGLKAGEQDLAKGAADLASGVGKAFAASVTNDPYVTPENFMNNPSVTSELQKLWESKGQTGPFDPAWGARQVRAVKDSENSFIMAAKTIDDAVAAGTIPKDVGDIMKNVGNNSAFWASFKKDANGNFVPDIPAMEKALGVEAGSLGGGANTPAATIPPKADGTTYAPGEVYVDPTTKKTMRVGTNGTASAVSFDPDTSDEWGTDANEIAKNPSDPAYQQVVEARANSIISTLNYSRLKGLSPTDPVYKKVLDSINETPFSYRNRMGVNDSFTSAPAVGTWIKSGDRMLKVTFSGHLNTAGTSDRAYMEFQDPDGNMYSTDGNSSTIVPGVNNKYTKK